MTKSTVTTEELLEGLQTLPQELYDMIFDLTLAYDFNAGPRILERKYKPPVQLQINRKIRAEFAEKYYGDRTSPWRVCAGDTPSTADWIVYDLPLSRTLLEDWLSAFSDDVLSVVLTGWSPSIRRPEGYLGIFKFAVQDESLYRAIFVRNPDAKSGAIKNRLMARDQLD